ncbi:MAG: hypothetical protein U0791_09305 [Gemmataceae bacterium]
MIAISGRMVDGKIELNSPPDWPEGTEVVVTPRDEVPFRMLTEDEQSDDPEEIEKWIAEMEAIPPLVMDPEDEARMWAAFKEWKEYSIHGQIEDPPRCPDA